MQSWASIWAQRTCWSISVARASCCASHRWSRFAQPSERVLAVGEEARLMLGRTPGNIIAVRPLNNGVIADYTITLKMLEYVFNKVLGRRRLFSPRVLICVPSGVTDVERRAVIQAAREAGAGEVHLIEEPMAAAIGAGLPISQPGGNMVVDIGGGTTDIAVISLGGIVISRSLRVAGNKMDEAIMRHVRNTYNLMIGERTAEEIKIRIGSAYPLPQELTMEVRGARPGGRTTPNGHYPLRGDSCRARRAGEPDCGKSALGAGGDPTRTRSRYRGARHHAHRWRRTAAWHGQTALPSDPNPRAYRR
jgi:MreB/Mrl family cell shape determining protein